METTTEDDRRRKVRRPTVGPDGLPINWRERFREKLLEDIAELFIEPNGTVDANGRVRFSLHERLARAHHAHALYQATGGRQTAVAVGEVDRVINEVSEALTKRFTITVTNKEAEPRRPYWILLVREEDSDSWTTHFGDYDLEAVQAEFDEEFDRSYACMVANTFDDQASIDETVDRCNKTLADKAEDDTLRTHPF